MHIGTLTPAGMIVLLAFSFQATEAYAKDVSLDCSRKSLVTEIGKLDPVDTNTITISGDCNEDVVISRHRNLTIDGTDGASITATNFDPASPGASTNSVLVEYSTVRLHNLTINSGQSGLRCDNRSVCTLSDVAILDGHQGLYIQNQSSVDVLGASLIADSLGTGIGVFGESTLNMRPQWPNGFDRVELGPVTSGHAFAAVVVQDGSFFRGDSIEISDNVFGIVAQRGAVVKVFQNFTSTPGITNNSADGIWLRSSSSAQIGTPITDNVGSGINIGPLSFLQSTQGLSYSNNGKNVFCEHATSVNATAEPCAP